MIVSQLKIHLDPILRRRRRSHLRRELGLCWAGGALVAGILLAVQRSSGGVPLWLTVSLGLVVGMVALVRWRRVRREVPDWLALGRRIEQHHPELQALLLTALEQQPDPQTGQWNYLQQRLIDEAVGKAAGQDWTDTVPGGRLALLGLGHWAALAALVFCLVRLSSFTAPPHPGTPVAGGVEVTPGDVTLESGEGLVVLARFSGKVPPEARLVIGAGLEQKTVSLTKNLADPVFGGSVPEIRSDLTYYVAYGEERTREYRVTVFEYPRLERADYRLVYPSYTGLAERRVEDSRRVTAIEGSRLDLDLHLNKPVATAELIAKDKSVLALAVHPGQSGASLTNYVLTNSQVFNLRLVDAEGRTNKLPTVFVWDVLTNRAPLVKLSSPRGDTRVSALEEVTFRGEVSDDFGLLDYGLGYTVAGQETRTISLGKAAGANEKRSFEHLLPLEGMKLQPGQLVSYFIWAEDLGPDGKPRRTAGDLFFAEVRPFDEVFRQDQSAGEQAGGQQEGEGQTPSTRLAELQKQIIQATWKLRNQEKADRPSAQYRKDLPVVQESQKEAIDQARQARERVEDAEARANWNQVEQEMTKASEQLAKAMDSTAPLSPALDAEQAAYQALLKLQAHEYRVSRNRNRSSRGQSTSEQAQQQVDQLDLEMSQNKYETQREATSPQTNQQREQLQVLNRLKELARRQQDLNEQLKDLQAALHEAKTQAERDELNRRLKRLREEEQQMLADIDALQQRMDNASDPSRMAEARQDLERTRAEVQRASAAMDQQKLSEALTAGTRAQRELQDTTEELRKQSANQFADDLRDLRAEARDLAQKEQAIADRMKELAQPKRKTLSDTDERKETADQLARQKQAMTNLLNRATQLSQQAEVSEPLLSRKLYDTLRQTQQQKVDSSLDLASTMLRNSYLPQASQMEQRARQGIEDFRKGVEGAAESVLGDEGEALRQARREIEDLARQVEREMAGGRSNDLARLMSAASQSSTNTNFPRSARGNASRGVAGQTNGLLASLSTNQAGVRQPGSRGTNQPGAGRGSQGNPDLASTPGGRQTGATNQAGAQQLASAGSPTPSPTPGTQPGGAQGQNTPGGQENPSGTSPGAGNPGEQSGQQASPQPSQTGNGQERGQSQGGRQPGERQLASAQDQQGEGQQGQGRQEGRGQSGQAQQGQGQAQQGQGQGQGQGQQGQPREGQQPNGGGQNGPGNRPGRGPGQPSDPQMANATPPDPQRRPGQPGGLNLSSLIPGMAPAGGENGSRGPLTGADFTQWAERLRDVQDMLDFPDLRNQVARVREEAQAIRQDYRQNRAPIQWDQVQTRVMNPLVEVRERIAEELAKREAKEPMVPLDRDPVPNRYSELVRRYYEQLGRDRQ